MSEIKREPIQMNEKPMSIELIQPELELSDFLPKHKYQFSEGTVLPESEQMYTSLLEFLEVNQELIINQDIHSQDEFSKGFKQAIALCRLWIDSIYLVKDEENETK